MLRVGEFEGHAAFAHGWKRADRWTARTLTGLLFTAVLLVFCAGTCHSEQGTDTAESNGGVDQMMAGLSDEQVRQLLLEELKKDSQLEEAGPQQMKGPAFFLARLLNVLSSGHDDNKEEVRVLFGSFSTLGPELYRVFIKL